MTGHTPRGTVRGDGLGERGGLGLLLRVLSGDSCFMGHWGGGEEEHRLEVVHGHLDVEGNVGVEVCGFSIGAR